MFRFVPIVTVLLILVAACGETGEEDARSPSPATESTQAVQQPSPVTREPSVTPAPSPSPGSTIPGGVGGLRVVLSRDTSWSGEPGELWISHLDGGERERLTREGEDAWFAGFAVHYLTESETAYYVTVDGEFARSLWALDLASGERSLLLTFESMREYIGDAAVTADGRYVAYAHVEGIEMVDTATGASQHLLDNGPRECDALTCFMHSRPRWSPDGSRLIVRKTFWEGGTTVIVVPFGKSIRTYVRDAPLGPWTANWSQEGESACGYGVYAEPSGLFIAYAPEWDFVDMLPHYSTAYPVAPFVASCSWIDERTVAFAVNVSRPDPAGGLVPQNSVELRAFDVQTGTERLVLEVIGDGQIYTGDVIAVLGTSLVITQQLIDITGSYAPEPSHPELVDVETGSRYAVLEGGDLVVALVP